MMSENGALSAADVAAVTNRGFGGFGGGYGDGGAFWIVILFLFAAMGGWGNNGWGGNGGGFYAADVQRGFDQQAVNSQLGNISNSINTLGLNVCQGFNGVTAGLAENRFTESAGSGG